MELVAEITKSPSASADRDEPGALVPAAGARAAAIALDALPDATDDALVRACVGGQREAFTELVRRYTNLLYWFVRGRLKDPVEVEEVTQEAMVRAYVDLPKLRAPRAFASWLTAIAGFILREKHRMDSRIINLAGEVPGEEKASAPTPPELLSREEIRERITVEVQRLPAHYRVALALKYMNGLSVDEIAERLMIPAGTVRSRLSRAYAILQRQLEGELADGAGEESPGPQS